jgi:hypothetical protein
VALLMLAALIVVALMFAAIVSTVFSGMHSNSSDGGLAQTEPYRISAPAVPGKEQIQPGKPNPPSSKGDSQIGKPNAPSGKGCDSADTQCIANQQFDNSNGQAAAVGCNPCLWTASPNYAQDGAHNVYFIETLGDPTVAAAIKQDLNRGWNLNIEVGSHDRALVFKDLNEVCEVDNHCHSLGKLGRILIVDLSQNPPNCPNLLACSFVIPTAGAD